MTIDYFDNIEATVAQAIKEDVGAGDLTAQLISNEKAVGATVITREHGIVCGLPWVTEVFKQVNPEVQLKWMVSDGDRVVPNQTLFTATGHARSILTAERPALNFLQTLSAVSTSTAYYANLIAHTKTTLLDTRKTIPGLRLAQKYAVSCGGGANHRIGLFDAFLIKENHIQACGSIPAAIETARAQHPGVRVEVEVESLNEFRIAVDSEPDWIMLDNFSLADMREAVASNTSIKLEASGGIESEDDLIAIAETGVDYISVGALTKHIKAMDLSMRLNAED